MDIYFHLPDVVLGTKGRSIETIKEFTSDKNSLIFSFSHQVSSGNCSNKQFISVLEVTLANDSGDDLVERFGELNISA